MKIAIQKRPEDWHRWFAWHPVKAGGALVWMEHVERRWKEQGYVQVIDPYDPGEWVGEWEYRGTSK